MIIKQWQKEIYKIAKDHGFWDDKYDIPGKLCLIHSEISEALEGYRKDISFYGKGGMAEELADCVIRVFDLAEHLGIDIEKAMIKKCAINKKRKFKHGKKF